MPENQKRRSKSSKSKQPSGFKDHDKLFKGAFGIRELALLHLQDQLESALQSHLNWDTFHQIPDSFMEGRLAEYYADIVYAVQLKNGLEARICFLYEHKSKLPDQPIYIQLLQYLLGIWRKNLEQDQPLMFVLPIIVYHGEEAWDIRPFSAEFPGLPEAFMRYIPTFEYLLTNISAMPDEMIVAKNNLGALRSLYLALKYALNEEMLKQNYSDILIFAGELGSELTQRLFFERIFEYLQRRTSISGLEVLEIIQNLPDNKKNLAMSTYDNIIQQGFEKGKKQGIEQGIEQGISLKNRLFVIELIHNTDFEDEKIALLVGTTLDFVLAVRAGLQTTT